MLTFLKNLHFTFVTFQKMSNESLSPDADFMRRACCIFGYLFDPQISPYPCTSCNDPDAEYTANLPDFEESLNDYLLREVHQADLEARETILNELDQKEVKMQESFDNVTEDTIQIGTRLASRTSSGTTQEFEMAKRLAENTVKRQQRQAERRHADLERKRKAKEQSVRQFQAEIKSEIEYKKKMQQEELKAKQVYGAARAQELIRKKEEREKKREEEIRKQEEAMRTVETISIKSRSLRITEEDLQAEEEKQKMDPQAKRQRMKEISQQIRQKNKDTAEKNPGKPLNQHRKMFR